MKTHKELIQELPESTRSVLLDTGLILNISMVITELQDKKLAKEIANLITVWVEVNYNEEAK